MKKKRVTIYDIAQVVGLTPNTVSRALNNKGYLSDDTRARVLKAANELNYVPNVLARSLKTSETKQILLAIPFISESFNYDLIAAAQNVIQDAGYSLLLMYTELDESKKSAAIETLMRNQADGLIMVTVSLSDALIEKIRDANKPCVVACIGNYFQENENLPFDVVCVDTKKGTYESTLHLIKQGHTDVAYIGPKIGKLEKNDRYAGFKLAMEEAGLPINQDYIHIGGHMDLFGYESGKRLLELDRLPTAICAGTDLIVLGLYRLFDQNNIIVSKDVSIVGMDNVDLCTLVRPRISSVYIAQEQIGTVSANIIIDRLSGRIGKEYKYIVFEPRLIERESSMNYHKEI